MSKQYTYTYTHSNSDTNSNSHSDASTATAVAQCAGKMLRRPSTSSPDTPYSRPSASAMSSLTSVVDGYAGAMVPQLQELGRLATAAGRAVSAASAIENGTLDADVHRAALEVLDSVLADARDAARQFDVTMKEGEGFAHPVGALLDAWKKDVEQLEAAARKRAAATEADNFAEAAGHQHAVSAAFESLRRDGQKLLETLDASAREIRQRANDARARGGLLRVVRQRDGQMTCAQKGQDSKQGERPTVQPAGMRGL